MSDGDGAPQLGLEPLTAGEWGDAEYAAFGRLLGIPGEKVPRAGSGQAYDPLNFKVIGLLVRHAELARAFLTFNGFLLRHSSLPLRLRELAILRVTHARRSAYLWGEHVKIAADGGMSDDDLVRLARGNAGFEEPTDSCSRRPTSYSPRAAPSGRRGTASSTSWARSRRWK